MINKAEPGRIVALRRPQNGGGRQYRNRMGTAVREIAAQLVAYAELPYGALRAQIQTECEGEGLGFRLRTVPDSVPAEADGVEG